jgi:hypothetical protein
VLAALQPHGTGWRGALPTAFGTFFGRPLGIDVETQSTGSGPAPAVNPEELDLAKTILAGLPQV